MNGKEIFFEKLFCTREWKQEKDTSQKKKETKLGHFHTWPK
jgi:hypothetical protein